MHNDIKSCRNSVIRTIARSPPIVIQSFVELHIILTFRPFRARNMAKIRVDETNASVLLGIMMFCKELDEHFKVGPFKVGLR